MRQRESYENPDCPGCRELREQLEQQSERLDEALRLIEQLNRRVAQLESENNRQAARFRVPEKKRKKTKGKPGRKKGHKPAYREKPPKVDEFAEAPLDRCPHCAGSVRDVRAIEQIIEDIPQVRVQRLQLTTYRGSCENCGTVRSTHPEQVSTATGAAGTHIGRRALALAADLNKHFGLTMRKTAAVLDEHFGLHITPGGLSQALDRIADKLAAPYDELRRAVRVSPAIHADETSWWLAGHSAWLWTFCNEHMSLYTIGDRSQQVIRDIIGDDYPGVLISDCLSSYDPHPGRKSKCCAHHLKAISEAMAQSPTSEFLLQIQALFKAAIVLHRTREALGEELDLADYWRSVAHLERRLDGLLDGPYGDAAEVRIANRLRKQRPHLLTFLHVRGVDPTNNLAERQLRPAVIARKLSCGNKTQAGASTWQVLVSLAATCRQQGRSFAEFVAQSMVLGRPPPPLFAGE
jgi:transposase